MHFCCYDVNVDEWMMMDELKDEIKRWQLRETSLGFWIEF